MEVICILRMSIPPRYMPRTTVVWNSCSMLIDPAWYQYCFCDGGKLYKSVYKTWKGESDTTTEDSDSLGSDQSNPSPYVSRCKSDPPMQAAQIEVQVSLATTKKDNPTIVSKKKKIASLNRYRGMALHFWMTIEASPPNALLPSSQRRAHFPSISEQ